MANKFIENLKAIFALDADTATDEGKVYVDGDENNGYSDDDFDDEEDTF